MSNYIIGIDVGGTNVKLGIVNRSGTIIGRSDFSTQNNARTRAKLIDKIAASTEEMLEENRISKKKVAGMGVGLPGLIDSSKGIVQYLPNIAGWRNVPLQKILKKKLGLPVFIENDVNMITLAEWKYGAGKGCKNFICITLGTGVGGGLILNDALYRGEGFVAGEIGHMPVGDKILEDFVGNGYLQQRAGKMFKNKKIELEEVFELAKMGNVLAVEFWQETATHLGTTLAGVVNLLNVRQVIIGGGVASSFKYLAPTIRKTIQSRAMKVQASMVKVVRSKLLDDAGIIGAQILVNEFGAKK